MSYFAAFEDFCLGDFVALHTPLFLTVLSMFGLETPPFFALYRTSCQRQYVALQKAVFDNEDTDIIFFEISLESSQICPWKHQDKPSPPYRGEPRNHCKNEQLTDILG